jgi:hypothetical protein
VNRSAPCSARRSNGRHVAGQIKVGLELRDPGQ